MATVSPLPPDSSSSSSRGMSSGLSGGLPRSDSPELRQGEMPALPSPAEAATRLEPGLTALSDLRLKMMQWLSGSAKEGGPAENASALPAAMTKTLADYLGEVSQGLTQDPAMEKSAMTTGRETLEQLLLRVLSQPGGEARLLAALPDLPRTAVATLLHAGLDAALLQADSNNGKNPEVNARASSLLRLLLRAVETENPLRPPASQVTASAETKPPQQGLARVLQADSEGDVQAGPQDPKGLSPKPGTPLYRVRLWEEGRSFTVLAPQAPTPGSLTRYALVEPGQPLAALAPALPTVPEANPQGGVFLSPVSGLPTTTSPAASASNVLPTPLASPLAADYAEAAPRLREALAAAEETLAELKSLPGYAQAVRDFAKLLGQMSWFSESPKDGMRATASEREGLLRLWLDFPPKPSEETATLRTWGKILRDPAEALPVLRLLRPLADLPGGLATSLGKELGAELGSKLGSKGEKEAGDPIWLSEKTLLTPVDAKAAALLKAALGPRPPGQAEAGLTLEQWSQMPAGAESKDTVLRAALQALLPEPKPEASLHGPSLATVNLYVFQAPQWQAVRVQGEALDPEKQGGRRSKTASPWMATVDWTGQALGQAVAQVKLTDADIDLDLRNSGEPAGAQVSAETVTLAAALQAQGLDLRAVNYRHAPESDLPAPDASELRVPRPIHSVDLRF